MAAATDRAAVESMVPVRLTAVLTVTSALLSPAVGTNGEQWVLDDSSGAAVAAVHRALTVTTK